RSRLPRTATFCWTPAHPAAQVGIFLILDSTYRSRRTAPDGSDCPVKTDPFNGPAITRQLSPNAVCHIGASFTFAPTLLSLNRAAAAVNRSLRPTAAPSRLAGKNPSPRQRT